MDLDSFDKVMRPFQAINLDFCCWKARHLFFCQKQSLIFYIFQLFIKDNQSGDEVTQLDYLGFIGSPVQATNMSDFKRVS